VRHEHLQHERISVLAQDLRLTALPDLYGGIAQNAANKKDVSYADFLEDVLKAERDARSVRSREILTRTAGFPALKRRWRPMTSRSPPARRTVKSRSWRR
jgi:DNA replication protein DnaC